MASAPTTRRRRSPEQDEPRTYVVRIEDWEWSLSFGVNTMSHRTDPYADFRHLVLRGKLLRPTNLKADTGELTLLPDPRLNWDQRQKDEPKCVGSLDLYRGRLTGLLSLPSDALPSLLQMLIGERLRYAVITSANADRRTAALCGHNWRQASLQEGTGEIFRTGYERRRGRTGRVGRTRKAVTTAIAQMWIW
ncbi:MAG: hypothetical protein R3D51_03350 [Hyphomicrobiaceae bacterium]